MRKIQIILLLSFLQVSSGSLAQDSAYASSRIVVKFTEGILKPSERKLKIRNFDLGDLDTLNSRYGLVYAERLYKGKVISAVKRYVEDISRIYVLHIAETFAMEEAIAHYKTTDYFDYVEPDYRGYASVVSTAGVEPDDEYYQRQWYLHNDGTFTLSPSTVGADLSMELAWKKQKGKSSVTLAIIDSGMKLDHPEFENRLWVNKVEIPGNNKDDDHNGYIDDVNGYDFAYGDSDPSDDYGHGTAMSGLAAANGNNAIGYTGVDWNCKIMTLKVLEADGTGLYSVWTEGIFYAVDHGADVINMSIGGSASSDVLKEGIKYAEANLVMVVAAMGNDDSKAREYPAAIPDCFAVGSTDSDDRRSDPFLSSSGGSNYGGHIDVVAPGNYIYILDHVNSSNYNTYGGGTSTSTALVSGVASLLKAQDPTRTPEQMRDILRNTADDMVGSVGYDAPGWDRYYGYGRINANAALATSGSSETAVLPGGISIFPNPTDGKFKLVYTLYQKSDVEISIYNRMGALVRDTKQFVARELGTYNQTFTLGTFGAGVYHLKFTHSEGVEVQKIVLY